MNSIQEIFLTLVNLVESSVFNFEAEEKMKDQGFFLTLISENHVMCQHDNLILRGELVFGFAGRLVKIVIEPSVEEYKNWKSIAKSLPTYQWFNMLSLADSVSRNTKIMFTKNIFMPARVTIFHRNVTPS